MLKYVFFYCDVQTSTDGQNSMTRAIVGVELLCFEKIIDFKDSSQPTITQVRCLTHHLNNYTGEMSHSPSQQLHR